MIHIYTDGACLNNPGPGGWGILVLKPNTPEPVVCSGGKKLTTNNQMELEAALQALYWLKQNAPTTPAIIYTDSMYVQQGITEWIHGWKRKNWITASKTPVKNSELWKAIDAAQLHLKVEWRWVKAHNGHTENEKVDQIARSQAISYRE
ncbi:ribonuclease HI [bacterium]|jgi:ribonuclease HI|nr:ribonuclease HI [bacterium]NBX72008.1 ribonuclease HI [bacterium]